MPENNREQKDQVKAFSEELDRQMAGLSTRPERHTDEDLVKTLEFARRLSALRVEPSPEFQANLKAALLQKIEAAEAGHKTKIPWWSRYLPQKPLWQAAAVAAAVLLVVGIAWASGAFRTNPSPITSPPPAGTSLPGKYVQATANTDKTVYAPGEEVVIQVTLENVSSESLTIAQYPPILSLMQVSTLEPVYTLPAGQTSRSLAPGQSISYSQTWDQVGFNGKNVPAGKYSLELEDIDFQGQAIKLTLARPVQFEIRDSFSQISPQRDLAAKYLEEIRPASERRLSDLLTWGPESAGGNM